MMVDRVFKFKGSEVRFESGVWTFVKPGFVQRIEENFENWLHVFPVLEYDPKSFIEFVKRPEVKGKDFPITNLVAFAIRNDGGYWLGLALEWLPFLDITYEIIESIKVRHRETSQKNRNTLWKYIICWEREQSKQLWEGLPKENGDVCRSVFADSLKDQGIDYEMLSDGEILVHGVIYKVV
ncbi:hypothetical protein FUAX_51570 (plasmid) [Fulvitalea axinellae]|uniref:Uncharacterized protein n=1 Tax=Fulvitalea axinellae TaxID=1182444 RepID=A0AAU9CUF4_9BACT|nr:hypothetical protein FUAX_51570 [Fulvitalea axinellae]